jgi:hypothetical protein
LQPEVCGFFSWGGPIVNCDSRAGPSEARQQRKTVIVRKLLRRNKIRCCTKTFELPHRWQPGGRQVIQNSTPNLQQAMPVPHGRDQTSDASLPAPPRHLRN